MAVPLQPIKTFGNGEENAWHNMLIFGDNLQAMKTLLQWKEEGMLINSDGTPLAVKVSPSPRPSRSSRSPTGRPGGTQNQPIDRFSFAPFPDLWYNMDDITALCER